MPLGLPWLLLGASWGCLGASWGPLGCPFGPLGCLWGSLGASRASLGCLLEPLGCPLDPLGCLLEPLGCLLGSLGGPWGPFGCSWGIPWSPELCFFWCINSIFITVCKPIVSLLQVSAILKFPRPRRAGRSHLNPPRLALAKLVSVLSLFATSCL